MPREFFVEKKSVVRRIWGRSDIILFIFAGSAAEFPLNKAVDWLYYTGKLPGDPLGRLFSTVSYARRIVFSREAEALATIDTMARVHAAVESARGSRIPQWAYRDVLFMLIDYSIRSFELLERRMVASEKEEVFRVFNRVGIRMGLEGLPGSYKEWLVMRRDHMESNLAKSDYTTDLFDRYREHIGRARFIILKEAQKLVIPGPVRKRLGFNSFSLLRPFVVPYRLARLVRLDELVKILLLPSAYKKEIRAMDLADV